MAWYRWAVALARAGQRATALQTARHAVPHAQHPPLLVNLGKLFEILEVAQEAVGVYRRATQLDPTFVEAQLGLASLLRRMGDARAATLTLRAAIARAPQSAAVALELAQALSAARQADEAAHFAAKALELGAPAVQANRILARAHAARGKVDASLAAIAQLPELDDEDVATLVAVARKLAQSGDPTAAVAALEHGRTTAPSAQAQLNIGAALAELGAGITAVEALRVAVRLSPESGPAQAALGKALATSGAADEATVALRAAVRLMPENAAAHAALAAQLGATTEAASLLVKAAAMAPEDEDIRDALAHALASAPRRATSSSAARPLPRSTSGSITSDLALFSVPELLEFLFQQRATGTLFLRGAFDHEGAIELSDGQLAGARSPGVKRLSDVLIEEDLVSRTDLMRSVPAPPDGDRDSVVATSVLGRHLLDRDALLEVVTRRVKDALAVMVPWREGSATFFRSPPAAVPPAVVVDMRWALMEVMRALDEERGPMPAPPSVPPVAPATSKLVTGPIRVTLHSAATPPMSITPPVAPLTSTPPTSVTPQRPPPALVPERAPPPAQTPPPITRAAPPPPRPPSNEQPIATAPPPSDPDPAEGL